MSQISRALSDGQSCPMRLAICLKIHQLGLASPGGGLAALTRLAGWSFGVHRTDQSPQLALLGLYRALAGD